MKIHTNGKVAGASYHFSEGSGFSYASVEEAVSELGVSCSTVRRWIKSGKLEGRIFEQGRRADILPSPRKYHITRESIINAEAREIIIWDVLASPRRERKSLIDLDEYSIH